MPEGKIEIHVGATPAVDTDKSNTPIHTEAHRNAPNIERDEKNIFEIREKILRHYNIDKAKTLNYPTNEIHNPRDMCVFYMLTDNKNPNNIYYADGHTAHAYLLNALLDKFGKELGSNDRSELPDDFFDKWTMKKGFIDPYKNGFKNFEHISQAIKQDFLRYKEENNLSQQTVKKLEKGEEVELPNWFIASSSRKHKK